MNESCNVCVIATTQVLDNQGASAEDDSSFYPVRGQVFRGGIIISVGTLIATKQVFRRGLIFKLVFQSKSAD